MTLHFHKVDDRTVAQDGRQPLPVPAGWQIAEGDADDIRVCGEHPWQSSCLSFRDTKIYRTLNPAHDHQKPGDELWLRV
jgi:hypothetical protein